jgi:hypothetical protein
MKGVLELSDLVPAHVGEFNARKRDEQSCELWIPRKHWSMKVGTHDRAVDRSFVSFTKTVPTTNDHSSKRSDTDSKLRAETVILKSTEAWLARDVIELGDDLTDGASTFERSG